MQDRLLWGETESEGREGHALVLAEVRWVHPLWQINYFYPKGQ